MKVIAKTVGPKYNGSGVGDTSSMGVYYDDIAKIGPEIIVPFF